MLIDHCDLSDECECNLNNKICNSCNIKFEKLCCN